MENISFTLNGNQVTAPKGSTILEAAKLNGVTIPTLCYLKDMNKIGACRMCLVEVEGARIPQAACITPVREGMVVKTESELAASSRRMNLELIAENHHLDCEYCPNYQGCELHTLFTRYHVNTRKYGNFSKKPEYDETALHLGRDASRCILCRRCVSACKKQNVNAIAVLGRGDTSRVAAPEGLGSSICIGCGQCAAACPTGAIFVKDDTRQVWVTLNQGKKPVVAVVAPPVGAALGEILHEPIGTNVTGKLVSMLHKVGVKRVYSMMEANAIDMKRSAVEAIVKSGKTAIASDCPAVVRYIENNYPELKNNLVDAPSQQIAAAMEARLAYAKETGANPDDITVITVTPCTAQKLERSYQEYEGVIDAALTTVEVAEMLHHACLSRYTLLDVWRKSEPEAFDPISDTAPAAQLPDAAAGDTSGAVRETTASCGSVELKCRTLSGMGSADALLREIAEGKAQYDYLAVRACPGGCVNGGGQPKVSGNVRNFENPAAARAAAL